MSPKKPDPSTAGSPVQAQGRLKPISLAPLTVDEALAALLKTPPPANVPGTRKVVKKKRKGKAR